jgi:3-oxoacyl-[acyl-carrier-protein] synthase-1
MSEPVGITALGVVSCVGKTVKSSCAAIRAGIGRPSAVQHFTVVDTDDHVAVPLHGYPVAGLTDGQGPLARWLVMGERAVRDLLADMPDPAAGVPAGQWGAVLVLPSLDGERFPDAVECQPEVVRKRVLDAVITETRVPVAVDHRLLVAHGAAGLGVAVEHARAWLTNAEVAAVLVLAVDSLIDASSLAWLAASRRLKDPANPVGLAPGEAAVAMLLTRPSASPGLHGLLATAATADAQLPFSASERRRGRALAAAIRQARDATGAPISGDIYADLNGETWRAAELGGALASLTPGVLAQYHVHTPAAMVGDTGAASAALAIACATRAFARGYSAARKSWVLTSSEQGAIGIFSVEACSEHG